MSTFAPIDQRLELERLLRMLRLVLQRTRKYPTFSVSQFSVLLKVYLSGPIQMSDFKRAYMINGSKLSRTTQTLRILGLIRCVRDERDYRKVVIFVTDDGRILVEEVLQVTI